MRKIFLFLWVLSLVLASCQVSDEADESITLQTFEYWTEDDWLHKNDGPLPKPEPITEFSSFKYSSFSILQLGEILKEADNITPKIFIVRSYSGNEKHVAIPIKIVKIFKSTAYLNDSGEPYFPSISQSNLFRDSKVSYFLECIKQTDNYVLPEGYDDILLIPIKFIDSLQIGGTYLASVDDKSVDVPIIDPIDSVNKVYPEGNTVYEYGNFGEESLMFFPIVDDRVIFTEEDENKCYVFDTANDYLTKVGLGDKIFKNGMSIEELEEYFDLVTNKETFAPLFESTSSGDTP